jgi:hypothetical protein
MTDINNLVLRLNRLGTGPLRNGVNNDPVNTEVNDSPGSPSFDDGASGMNI